MPFGKEVGNLLHFERSFQRHREVELPPKEKHAICPGVFSGDGLNLITEFQNHFDLAGQRFECFDDPGAFGSREVAHPAEDQPE